MGFCCRRDLAKDFHCAQRTEIVMHFIMFAVEVGLKLNLLLKTELIYKCWWKYRK